MVERIYSRGASRACGGAAAEQLWADFNYHAVPGNRPSIGAFHREICRVWLHALRRRNQRTRMNWQRFKQLIQRWLPKPETKHPYPWARFEATHPM